MRSTSATAIVTSPAITSPRSSTWSSVSSSDSSSSSSSSNSSSAINRFRTPLARNLHSFGKVVRRPRAGQLEAEAEGHVLGGEAFGGGAKVVEALAPDEEGE